MKGLMSVLFLVVGVSAIGCGAAPECDCSGQGPDCLDGFFEAYYPECVVYFDEYNEWLAVCGETTIADPGECVRNMWMLGTTNEECGSLRKGLADKMELPDGTQPDQQCGYASEYAGPGCPPGARYEPTN